MTATPTATPAAVPSDRQTGANRRRDIQGLRAVAVALVVVFHAGLPVSGGFVGVDVFFVISGFVITAMLQRELLAHGRLRFAHFYLRRFLRLTPALALTVGVVAVASFLLQNPFGAQQTTARTGAGAMLLSANFVIAAASGDYFSANAITNPLLNTWSLSVEEQFYLAFPALLAAGWLLARRRRIRHAPLLVVTTIGLASFAVSLVWSHGGSLWPALTDRFGGPGVFAFYSSAARAWEFAAGAALALVLARLPAPGRRIRVGGGVVGLVLIGVSALTAHEGAGFPGLAALVPVAGTTVVLWSGSYGADGVARVLATGPFVAIGDLSYSWYLWHWPVIVFAALLWPNDPVVLVVAALVSLAPAAASYVLVEQPLRRLRPRSRSRAAGVIGATVAIPIGLCVILLVGANAGWGGLGEPAGADLPVAQPLVPATTSAGPSPGPAASPGPVTSATGAPSASPTTSEPPTTSASPDPNAPDPNAPDPDGEVTTGEGGSLRSQHAAVRAGCVNTPLDPVHCRFGAPDARGTILLAGDSQAYAVADGAIAAATALGYDIVVTSHTGCPFLARESSGKHNHPCRSWQKSIVDYATSQRPDLVVIANRSAGYVHPEWDYRTAARADGGAATTQAEAVDLWRAGLTPVVRDLTAAGVPVMFVAAVPEMTGYVVRESVLGAVGAEPFEVSRAAAEKDRRPALDVEQGLADQFPGVSIFDPNPSLCTRTTCAADGPDGPVYQDETHLSLAGSLGLADRFAEAISAAVRTPATPR